MAKITIEVSDRLLRGIERLAAEGRQTPSELAALLLRRGFETSGQRAAMEDARGQRPGAEKEARLAWWREAKFGLFIHWGLYALPAGVWKGDAIPGIGEWIMHRAEIPAKEYEKLAEDFNPVRFDAAAWVSLAKRAGQRYIVITSKHHDGFCLFHSSLTRYNVADGTPFGRDILKELAEECRKQDMRLGFYYSQTQDWHHPGGDGNDWDFDPDTKDFDGYIEDYVKPQVRELLTHYGPVALIWFDTPKRIRRDQSQSLLDLVHELQPDCLVSGRLGNGLGDYASAGDNRIPDSLVRLDWETPATINDTWGFKTNDKNWKSATELLHKLIDIVSKGGNYLLNVGPTAEGIIPRESVERLEAVGGWLERNGESIYGTVAGPIQGDPDYRTTQKAGTLYVHVLKWPEDGRIVLRGVEVENPRLLAGGEPVSMERRGDSVTLHGASSPPDSPASVIALDLRGSSGDHSS